MMGGMSENHTISIANSLSVERLADCRCQSDKNPSSLSMCVCLFVFYPYYHLFKIWFSFFYLFIFVSLCMFVYGYLLIYFTRSPCAKFGCPLQSTALQSQIVRITSAKVCQMRTKRISMYYVVPPWTQRTLTQWPERKTKNIVHNILIDKYIVWDSFFFVCPIAICSTGNVWRHIFFFCCEYAMTIWTKIACSVNRYYIYVFLVYFLFSSAIVEKGFWRSDPTHPNNMSIDPYVRVECGYCGITNTDSG